ncbi:N-(5'-phosphoribosyl)anthranilate isomerase [Arenicella chitinivorans]|uniref:N-(5'-phosphoribosyl)anthranilate isomerase n=2 Tax=Arenicella chitinivorans TaxID=1329800 RepID=A0A918RKN9_9GAMM|nr:N-(5'-phosphoribosyl)anthranilate isomerase [Arenicella chitinivorans]
MTDPLEVRHAVACGVDAIGVILHADSPRTISVTQAQKIRAVVPPFVSLVGVVVDCATEQVNQYIHTIGLDLVQLHGAEKPDAAEQLMRPYIKAIRAQSPDQVARDIARYPNAAAILLDPYVEGQHGGTGSVLSDALWPPSLGAQPTILAGGLSPKNIAARIRACSPYAVDVNSGVESAPGVKDPSKVAEMVARVFAEDAR